MRVACIGECMVELSERPDGSLVRGFGGAPHAYSVVRRSSPAWERTVARKRAVKRALRR